MGSLYPVSVLFALCYLHVISLVRPAHQVTNQRSEVISPRRAPKSQSVGFVPNKTALLVMTFIILPSVEVKELGDVSYKVRDFYIYFSRLSALERDFSMIVTCWASQQYPAPS